MPTSEIQIIRTSSSRVELAIRGRLDSSTAELVEAEAVHFVKAGRRRIRVDTSEVTVIDGHALDALVGAANRVRRAGGSLTVCGAWREDLFRSQGADVAVG